MDKFIKKIFTYRYLMRLIITCIVFFLIPCVLMLYFTMRNSYHKLQDESQNFYLTSSQNYFDSFLNEMNSMITLSYQISSDSRIADRPAYSFNSSLLNTNPYYFLEAVHSIDFYRNNINNALTGIYYPDNDWLITSSYKSNARSYVTSTLQITTPEQIEEICNFMNGNLEEKLNMYSLFSSAGNSGFLLLTVSTYIGNDKTPVVLLYRMDETSLQNSFLTSAKLAGLQFLVYDGDTENLLLSVGSNNVDISTLSFHFDYEKMKDGEIRTLKQDGREYTSFLIYNETMNFYYGVIGFYDEIYNSSLSYFKTMLLIVSSFMLALLFLLILLIYINYKPIYALMRKVLEPSRDGEFATISTAIDNMTDELNELNLLLKDYLMENILQGKPVNETLIHRLGITSHQGHFRVYTVSGASLNTEERVNLTEEILDKFVVPSFITDILMENITVIICLIPHNDGTGITEYLKMWLTDKHKEASLGEGCIVDSINKLQESYLSCGTIEKTTLQKYQEAKSNQATEKAVQLAQEIMKYLQENFCDPDLSQSIIADHFHISTYTLSRLFKDQFGIGFVEFITSQRMEYAKQLLLTTNEPVGKIATQVGLPNMNYFSRVFKNATGTSPTKYRAGR